MGADFIGYWVFVPQSEYASILKKHLKEIGMVLKCARGKAGFKHAVKMLAERGVDDMDLRDGCVDSDKEFLGQVREWVNWARGFRLNRFNYRDATSSCVSVNGQKVSIFVAGDRSWGDEPATSGYCVLKALDKLGLAKLFYDAIRWGKRKPSRRAKR